VQTTDPALSGVQATAFIRAAHDGSATTVTRLRNSGPFHLRQTPPPRVSTAVTTIALPGSTGAPATYDVRLTVADHAMLTWLPKPLISARGSTLHQTCTVDLAPSAAVLLREEQLLGRIPEPPGHLTTRLTLHRGGRLLIDQQTAYGGTAPAWDGPAVLGAHRAIGQLLVATATAHTLHHVSELLDTALEHITPR
jgi:urease accessory protein